MFISGARVRCRGPRDAKCFDGTLRGFGNSESWMHGVAAGSGNHPDQLQRTFVHTLACLVNCTIFTGPARTTGAGHRLTYLACLIETLPRKPCSSNAPVSELPASPVQTPDLIQTRLSKTHATSQAPERRDTLPPPVARRLYDGNIATVPTGAHRCPPHDHGFRHLLQTPTPHPSDAAGIGDEVPRRRRALYRKVRPGVAVSPLDDEKSG